MIFNHELGLRFFNGEGHTFDLLEDLNHIECRILLLTGEDDPLPQLKMPPISRAAFLAPAAFCSRFANAGHGVFRNDRQTRCTKSSTSSSSAKPEFMPAPTLI
jgi:pimeloyl-ACP methyl ester carboxylesterase